VHRRRLRLILAFEVLVRDGVHLVSLADPNPDGVLDTP
jgi:hypothetical protein